MIGAVRILISVDMEGIAGVAVPQDVSPGSPAYPQSQRLMTEEANAAIRGVFDFDEAAEVLVADAHGPFTNLLPDLLDPRAQLIRGRPRPLGMVTGIEGAAAAIFIGYHGRVGTETSVLSHTISGAHIAGVRCQGRPLGEIGLNSALASELGVPVVLVSGDDTVAREAQEINPGVATVAVKQAIGANAAVSLHPQEVALRLRTAVPEALRHRAEVRTLSLAGPVGLEVDFHREVMAEPGLLVPGVQRLGPVTLGYAAQNVREACEIIRLLAVLAGTA